MSSTVAKIFGWDISASWINKLGGLVNWGIIGGTVAAIASGHAPVVSLDLHSPQGIITSAIAMGIAELYRRSHPGGGN